MAERDDCPKKKLLPKGWKKAYIKALERCGVVIYSCRKAGVSEPTVNRHRIKDPAFNAACDRAIEVACDELEIAARKRAVKGVKKPIFQGGQQVGEVQEYSDTLLIFLLKGNRPWKYRDGYDLRAAVEQLMAQQSNVKPVASGGP